MKVLCGRLIRVNLTEGNIDIERIGDEATRKYLGGKGLAVCYAFKEIKSGRMNEHIAAFVNSREIRSLEGLDTKLKDGDIITILPPMAGG